MRRARGYIKKRGNSYLVAVSLPVDAKTGTNPHKWETVRGTKDDAEKRLTELLRLADTGNLANPARATVGSYMERWLSDYATPNLSPRTTEGYRTIVKNHLIPTLGHYSLQKLTPARIAEYYREKQQHGRVDGKGRLSSTTVRQHAMVLHKAFETAIEWGLLARNPADKVKIPRPAFQEWAHFDESGVRRILEASREHPLHPVFVMAIGTGMRRSEFMGLRWCDIDLKRRAIYITRTLHQLHTGEYVIRPPKTASGKRTIKLTEEVVEALRKYRAHREAEAVMLGINLDEQGLVVANGDGSHVRPNYVTRIWNRYAAECDLQGVRLHDARHFHATLLLKRGVHPKIVQSRLGHGSIKVTMDIYSHAMESMQDAAIEGFDDAVFSEPEES